MQLIMMMKMEAVKHDSPFSETKWNLTNVQQLCNNRRDESTMSEYWWCFSFVVHKNVRVWNPYYHFSEEFWIAEGTNHFEEAEFIHVTVTHKLYKLRDIRLLGTLIIIHMGLHMYILGRYHFNSYFCCYPTMSDTDFNVLQKNDILMAIFY